MNYPGGDNMVSSDTRNRFGFHKLDPNGIERMQIIREMTLEFAKLIETICPEGKLRGIALTQLQHTMTSANLAISQTYPLDV